MDKNILSVFLNLLNVRYTRSFIHQYFNEHPHKYNLFGLSSMLSDYDIMNTGVKIHDKNEIHSITAPFIAHTGNDFVVVEKIFSDEIQFIERDKRIKIELKEFLEIWTGYALLAEADKTSIEPGYKANLKKEIFNNFRKISILSIFFFLTLFTFISNASHLNIGMISLFLMCLTGSYIGYLLVLKQLRIHSDYADKLCSLFKYTDCNNILDSKASKLFGIIGWSEIGLGYFISNVIVLSLTPSLTSSLLFINFFSLPYTLWSIWYQKFKAKQWCPLCLITMLLLWSVCITGLFSGLFNFDAVTIQGILIVCCIYTVSILAINLLIPVIARSSQMESIQYEINSIKADEDVFEILLKKQPHYKVDKEVSKILLEK